MSPRPARLTRAPRATRTPSVPVVEKAPLNPKTREGHFRTLSAGDLFKVKGVRGTFRFTALVTNTKTGQAWVEAAEATGAGKFRAFGLTKEFVRPRKQTAGKGDQE